MRQTPKTPVTLGAWLAFAVATVFFLFEFVARILPSLATDGIGTWYGLGSAGTGTLSSLFFWVYAPMQIAVGVLLDRYGARRLVLPAIAVCATGVALFAASDAAVIGGLARALTGLGASFAFVGALYVVNHRFAPTRFALLSGLVNAVGMLGTAIGAVWLSGLIQAEGWRMVCFQLAGVGALIFGLAVLFLHDGDDAPETAPGSHPLHTLKPLLRDGRVWRIALMGALFYVPVNVYGGLWGKAQLMHDRALGDTQAELAVSMLFWGMALGSVAAGWLSDRLGHRKYIVLACTLLTAATYGAALFLPGLGLVPLAGLLFAAGTFNGAQMLSFAMAKEGHPPTVSGTIIAFVNMIGIAGALVFQPLLGALIDAAGGAFGPAMLTIPASGLLAALLTLTIREYRHPDHVD
ncbi:MFS transporter [Actibacterium ureilyticum]|uniref:MFS transporter n=1 Tax=Actibacterium ureilyticum TaxID=1590614 RepID=UPI000BAB026E|nr:MFS transporter [Actibacterium ureilyticum]